MNKKRKFKLITTLAVLLFLSIAVGLILFALKQNINLFYTPSELTKVKVSSQTIRLGGYVKPGSVKFSQSGREVVFIVTDKISDISVKFNNVLPNLFREGQTVVITGKRVSGNQFVANEVLAKHDERYIPANLKQKLKENHYDT